MSQPTTVGLQMYRSQESSTSNDLSSSGILVLGAFLKIWLIFLPLFFFFQNSINAQPPLDGSPLVVTNYALTSAHDVDQFDPRNWRLLGSGDGGKSWTVLDTQTNQSFRSRSQRRNFQLTNELGYATYR